MTHKELPLPLIELKTCVLGDDLFILAVHDTSITWDAAAQAARDLDLSGDDGHLMTTTSLRQSDFIRDAALSMPDLFSGVSGPWIGLSRATARSPFGWITGEDVDFTDWSPGEPNDFSGTGEPWVQILGGSGQWNDNPQGGNAAQHGFTGEEIASAANIITGSIGDDILEPGGGPDEARGAHGNLSLDGGPGSDRLSGGRNDDTGGPGAGRFVFGLGHGNGNVTDFDAAVDRLVLSAGFRAGSLTGQQVVDSFATDTGTGAILSFGADSMFLTGADLADLAAAIDII
jgi:hypothetical protein